MSKTQLLLLLQWLLFILTQLFSFSTGDVGTAAQYSPPYLPSACYGNDVSQFPTNNLFASASEGIWDNGASCGRQYLVRCISASEQGICVTGVTIPITIVDREVTSISLPSTSGTTMALSETAFALIADLSANEINIEFQQV
ncbi:Expansin/pollen allergen [Macleaya cordata]|uniref:Expansin/pollen allergen n=1 Tax=Macleaya cordata TaxID=56857 RepID=A0A200R8R2_MACCD|nr:Expansin/pollen allergen [Macleaya cordata]